MEARRWRVCIIFSCVLLLYRVRVLSVWKVHLIVNDLDKISLAQSCAYTCGTAYLILIIFAIIGSGFNERQLAWRLRLNVSDKKYKNVFILVCVIAYNNALQTSKVLDVFQFCWFLCLSFAYGHKDSQKRIEKQSIIPSACHPSGRKRLGLARKCKR